MSITRSYGVLKPGAGKIDACLWNHSTKQVTVPKQTAVGEITAANAIPALLVLKPTENAFEGLRLLQKKQMEGKEKCLTKLIRWNYGIGVQKIKKRCRNS